MHRLQRNLRRGTRRANFVAMDWSVPPMVKDATKAMPMVINVRFGLFQLHAQSPASELCSGAAAES